ncbi:MAG: hypothetical protein JWM27_4536 [Gemmatimonadetes bacterium]|nr:hypothetical protein [Gemmatimonadota bacterium]
MAEPPPPPVPAAAAGPEPDWAAVSADPDFRALVAARRRFIVPATVFFIAYYFALPVLVGYFPGMMDRHVLGDVNLAYLFALSQFFMAWILMAMYVRRARTFDAMAARIAHRVQGGGA